MTLSVNTWVRLTNIVAVWLLSLSLIMYVCSGKNEIILSCCSLFVCLIVCYKALTKATGWDELVETPIIKETAFSIDVNMDISGIMLEDIHRLQSELEKWKEEKHVGYVVYY